MNSRRRPEEALYMVQGFMLLFGYLWHSVGSGRTVLLLAGNP